MKPRKKRLTKLTNKGGKSSKSTRRRKTPANGRPKAAEPDWKPMFLEQLETRGAISAAAKAAGVSKQAAYKAAKRDPEFKDAWDEAIETACDAMELEARRRAVDGTDRPVFHAGKVVGHVREYSDQLLIFLLRAHRPQKYRERNGLVQFDPTRCTNEQLARIVAGEDPIMVLATSAPAPSVGTP